MPKHQPYTCHSVNTDTYIEALDGFFTVFLLGVVHKRTQMVQQHLYAVNCPDSESETNSLSLMSVELLYSDKPSSRSVIKKMLFIPALFDVLGAACETCRHLTVTRCEGGQTEVAHLLKSS